MNTSRKKRYLFAGLAAACLMLAAGIYIIGTGIKKDAQSGEGEVKDENIRTAESYDEIYTYFEEQMDDYGAGSNEGIALLEMRGLDESSEENAYSITNTRQEGVDEADIVKTDGRYLYVLQSGNQEIALIDTKGELQKINSISMDEGQYVQEFYLLPEEEKLVVLCSYYMNEQHDAVPYDYARMVWDASVTQAITYDVSDILQPEKIGFVDQSGSYISSRMTENHLYLFSRYSTGGSFEKDEPEMFIPRVADSLIEADDIYLPHGENGCMYEVITSIDMAEPDKVKDSKAVFTNGGEHYVSNENIFFYETQWATVEADEKTTLRKISYDKGELQAVAAAEIDGYINDSFSIDEYNGNLRVIVTVGETNSVYVMDNELKIIGKIEDLAEEERVYSARFMGETAYFVTFYETDPLFTVDFSNPKDPQIIGKLKIPGFSDYLHFYGEGKLLGIGMNVDEETFVTEGAKLTMFDISDKTDVKEEATYILENIYSTDVSYDYKATLIDASKNIIGFSAYEEGGQNYYVFTYSNKEGFVCELCEEMNGYGSGVTRGVYIEDTLYVVQGNIIEAYSLENYKKLDDTIL